MGTIAFLLGLIVLIVSIYKMKQKDNKELKENGGMREVYKDLIKTIRLIYPDIKVVQRNNNIVIIERNNLRNKIKIKINHKNQYLNTELSFENNICSIDNIKRSFKKQTNFGYESIWKTEVFDLLSDIILHMFMNSLYVKETSNINYESKFYDIFKVKLEETYTFFCSDVFSDLTSEYAESINEMVISILKRAEEKIKIMYNSIPYFDNKMTKDDFNSYIEATLKSIIQEDLE